MALVSVEMADPDKVTTLSGVVANDVVGALVGFAVGLSVGSERVRLSVVAVG